MDIQKIDISYTKSINNYIAEVYILIFVIFLQEKKVHWIKKVN